MTDGISIHAPHEGERRSAENYTDLLTWISIHAPHEGERPGQCCKRRICSSISIHAPHEGERLAALVLGVRVWAFQSTLPTRGSDNLLGVEVE